MPRRRDKYEKHIREYWVSTKTWALFEDENAEELSVRTCGEGTAAAIEVGGLPTDDPPASGDEPEDGSSDDDDGDDDASKSATSGKGRNNKKQLEEELALEACLLAL